uniref:SWIRM domain-containing protein n=1 Tax=Rhodosorus marinus TaxID=101924 RepID=A0A7S3EQC3_9RHOD|mmetsp:Transcript_9594/g.41328  ORF Transcript_9594/g.41328 Transcript_9594/m.41328 type:complete len:1076 (+) Transcript_9594:107-3334(+)
MDTPRRTKSVAVSLRSWEEPGTGDDLSGVCESIKSKEDDILGFSSKDITPRSLLLLSVRMMNFMDLRLGLESAEELRVMTKIPCSVFRDTKPNGGLETILCAALKWKADNMIRKFEWSNPDKAEQLLEMLAAVELALSQGGFLSTRKVFLTRAIPANMQPKLRAIVLKKRGVVVSTSSAATHIIYPDPEGTRHEDTEGEDFCRGLETRGMLSKVHWWYYPDCYDSWIPIEDVEGDMEPEDPNPKGPWHVQMRYIQDTDSFNEWMNEVDYEIPEDLRINVIPAPRRSTKETMSTRSKGELVGSVVGADGTTASHGDESDVMESTADTTESRKRKLDSVAEGDAEKGIEKAAKSAFSSENLGNKPGDVGGDSTGLGSAVPAADSGEDHSLQKRDMSAEGTVDNQQEAGDEGKEATPGNSLAGSADAEEPGTAQGISSGSLKVRIKLTREGSRGLEEKEVPVESAAAAAAADSEKRNESTTMEEQEDEKALTASQVVTESPIQARKEENMQLEISKEAKSPSLNAANLTSPKKTADLSTPPSQPKVPIRIPSYALWYKPHAVHDIERRGLPEFFQGKYQSKTEKVYKEYRNFMVESWRKAPEKYLSATFARRHLAGDACAILRVHVFLEHWGLINHGVDPQTRPQPMIVPPPAPLPLSLETGERRPKMLLFDDGGPVISNGKFARNEGSRLTRDREDAAAAVEYHCDSCERDCSLMRFHCSTRADMDLCPECYNDGNFPQSISSRDFIQMTAVSTVEGHHSTSWTETEILLLLEALELYRDNWELVAEHVGSKSKDACVLQFIRLPIEDSFLKEDIGKLAREASSNDYGIGATGLRDLTGQPLPFTDMNNPLMAHLAFMGSTVPSSVSKGTTASALEKAESLGDQITLDTTVEDILQKGVAEVASATALERMSAREASVTGGGRLPHQFGDEASLETASSAVALAAAAVRCRKKAEKEAKEIDEQFSIVMQTKLETVMMKLEHYERLKEFSRREEDRAERKRYQQYADLLAQANSKVANSPVVDRGRLRVVLNTPDRPVVSAPPIDENASAQLIEVGRIKYPTSLDFFSCFTTRRVLP